MCLGAACGLGPDFFTTPAVLLAHMWPEAVVVKHGERAHVCRTWASQGCLVGQARGWSGVQCAVLDVLPGSIGLCEPPFSYFS